MATTRILRSARSSCGPNFQDVQTARDATNPSREASEPTTPPLVSRKRKREYDPQSSFEKEGYLSDTPKRISIKSVGACGNRTDTVGGLDSKPTGITPRLVAPGMSNAPLITPRGTRVIAVPAPGSTLTKEPNLKRETVTSTTDILSQACTHLVRVDPKMKALIEAHPCHIFSPEGLAEECECFRTLASGIMGQQVSGAAASSIRRKFVSLFRPPVDQEIDSHFPTPQEVAPCSIAFLRQAGLSERKAEYIQGLAEKFAAGDLSASWLLQAKDEEVMERLVQVRGLGRWSAEMFAIFGLRRLDIFSSGDLGIQRGMAAFVGRDVGKLKKAKAGGKWKYMSEKEMIELSQKFSPYRSVFMFYMWKLSDTSTNVLEGDK